MKRIGAVITSGKFRHPMGLRTHGRGSSMKALRCCMVLGLLLLAPKLVLALPSCSSGLLSGIVGTSCEIGDK